MGNTGGTDSTFTSVTIVSITLTGGGVTLTGSAAGKFVLADGTDAGATITFAQLAGLTFSPASNVYGAVTIVFTLNDGQQNSDQAQLKFTVASVNDLPSDIELSGDRDTATGKDNEQYVLVDGKITTKDGTIAGALSAADFETNADDATGSQTGITYALSGTHGALFEVVGGKLQLKSGATPLAAGEKYTVVITATDSDGGTYSETFTIIQGGAYVETGAAGSEVRTYSDGKGLADENATGPVLLGKLGEEGVDAASANVSWALAAGGANNADFALVGGDTSITLGSAATTALAPATDGGVRNFTLRVTDGSGAMADTDFTLNLGAYYSYSGSNGATQAGTTHNDIFDTTTLLFFPSAPNTNVHTYDGGAGSDTLVLNTGNAQPFALTLNGSTEVSLAWSYTPFWPGANPIGQTLKIKNIENIVAAGANVILNITGDAQDNYFVSNADQADTLNGAGGNDTLNGGNGADTLNGGTGNDILIGGDGADMLTGGAGNDIFVLDIATTETKDAVTDFGTGTDKIRVDTSAGNETTLSALQNAANLRWTNNTNEATGSTNDAGTNDTVIYNTKGTADTADDVIIMILEDYTTDLTIDNFEII